MSDSPTIPPFVNKSMKSILRSPFHGLVSKSVLLISFKGCKSGKVYTTPVSYSLHGDQVYIFTHASWWKNLCANDTIRLRIRGKDVAAIAETITDDKETIVTSLAAHLQKVPSDAKYYGVTFDQQNQPNLAEVRKAVQTVTMIRARI